MAEPALELTIRQKEGLSGFIGQDCVADDRSLIAGQDVKSFQYNASGTLLAVVKVDSVSVYNTQTKAEKISFAVASVAAVSFSPQNSFLTMFESFRSNFSASSAPAAPAAEPAAEDSEAGESSSSSSSSAAPSSSPAKETHQNLSVWDLETGEKIYARTQKIFIRDQWPSIRWTHDECVGAMIVSTGVQFFSGRRFTTVTRNLKKPNIKLFSWAPNSSSSNYVFSIFITAAKSSPSSVGLYSYPNVDRAVCFKSTFNADSADLKWNATGTALLAHTRSDVDRTGKSYYGETNLLYLNSSGDSQFVVDTPPIFDAGWSPSGDKFFAVYGTLPAHTRIFTSKCDKFADFPVNHYNSGYFSPNGKMIILAGFGNLQGQVDIWDVQNAKLISSQVIPCTTYLSWSPCSRFFFTATLSPRLRVDNGFKIWTPTGTLVKTVLFPELYQVDWKPINASAFAEYIPSPAEYCAPPKAAEGSAEPPKPKPGAYVPPHLRGQAAAAPAPAKETPKQGTRFTEEMLLRESLPVGAMEKKKKKTEATTQLPAHFSSPAPSVPFGTSPSSSSRGKRGGKRGGRGGRAEESARISQLEGELQTINELKRKQSNGETLTPDQITHITREASISQEVNQLKLG